MGQTGMIGKGARGPEVVAAMRRTGAVYFAAIGGAGAAIAEKTGLVYFGSSQKIINTDLLLKKPGGRMSPAQFRVNMMDAARKGNKRIVLPEGAEPRTVQAAAICHEKGIARCVLLAPRAEVEAVAKERHITLPDSLEIIYGDDGHGMDEENLFHHFEPFYTTMRNSGGSGLGVYVVYNLVTQRLKGSIHVESAPDKGIKYIIQFPVRLTDPDTCS